MRSQFFLCSIIVLLVQVIASYFYHPLALSFILTLPLVLLGIYDCFQKDHTIMVNYPLFGRLRYVMEVLRPKIYQYFVESDTDGRPIDRLTRSVVYQRAKGDRDTTPFGTQRDVYKPGHEWMGHSMYPQNLHGINTDPRVLIGESTCQKPYSASLLNISAMSYGALSKTAVMSLGQGARMGKFAHNTGEGGVSPYHLKTGADLIWQIGTGYFGCRDHEGNFSLEKFKEVMANDNIKMVEIKLSQGAKPGHGGILPAEKNNQEIATIRGVEVATEVISPSCHNAFSDYHTLLDFICLLRKESGGRPIGIKLCVGHPHELQALISLMKETTRHPDYIAVDGAEGGTGAAPLEFTDSLGMPLKDALVLVDNLLLSHGIRDKVKLAASGKILTGFNMAQVLALGADFCYSARGMMLALGCIQALECNTNNCPSGIATQNKGLYMGLDVESKKHRVKRYHHETIKSFAELLAASGLSDASMLSRSYILRRISELEVRSYEDIYPYPLERGLLKKAANS